MTYSIGVPLLLLLESTFIFTVMALLFHQRHNIGKAPFVTAFSALALLTLLAMGADIQAHLFGGLFFRAAQELDIDIGQSYMIGDRISDLEAGRNAGCRQGFLVDSFYFAEHAPKARAAGFCCVSTVADAVRQVLELEKAQAL